jgi:hypothetical protein
MDEVTRTELTVKSTIMYSEHSDTVESTAKFCQKCIVEDRRPQPVHSLLPCRYLTDQGQQLTFRGHGPQPGQSRPPRISIMIHQAEPYFHLSKSITANPLILSSNAKIRCRQKTRDSEILLAGRKVRKITKYRVEEIWEGGQSRFEICSETQERPLCIGGVQRTAACTKFPDNRKIQAAICSTALHRQPPGLDSEN